MDILQSIIGFVYLISLIVLVKLISLKIGDDNQKYSIDKVIILSILLTLNHLIFELYYFILPSIEISLQNYLLFCILIDFILITLLIPQIKYNSFNLRLFRVNFTLKLNRHISYFFTLNIIFLMINYFSFNFNLINALNLSGVNIFTVSVSLYVIFSLLIIYRYLQTNEIIKNYKIFIMQLQTIIIYRYGWLIYGYHLRTPNSTWIFGNTHYIMVKETLSETLWYLDWPGLFYFSLPIYSIIQNPWVSMIIIELLMLSIVQYLLNKLFFLTTYNSLKYKYSPLGATAIIILQNINIWYYTSSFFGYLLYLIIWILCIKTIYTYNDNKRNLYEFLINNVVNFFILFLLFYIIYRSHVGTILFLASNALFILIYSTKYFTDKFSNKLLDTHRYSNFIFTVSSFFILTIATVLYYYIQSDVTNISSIPSTFVNYFLPYFQAINFWVTIIQIVILFAFTLIILEQIYYHYKNRLNHKELKIATVILFSNFFIIGLTEYGDLFNESRQRVYVFSLIPLILSHFLIKRNPHKNIIIIVLILLFISPYAYYGRDYLSIPNDQIIFTDQAIEQLNGEFELISERTAPIRVYTGDIKFHNLNTQNFDIFSINYILDAILFLKNKGQSLYFIYYSYYTKIQNAIETTLSNFTNNDVRFMIELDNIIKASPNYNANLFLKNGDNYLINLTSLYP